MPAAQWACELRYAVTAHGASRLQLDDLDVVEDLVPLLHDQMAGTRVHGVELAARVAVAQHVLGAHPRGHRVREAGDGGVARAGGVHGLDRRGGRAVRAALVERDGSGGAHAHDHPGDAREALVGAQGLLQARQVVGGERGAEQVVDLGEVGLDERGLRIGGERGVQRGTRGVQQHGDAGRRSGRDHARVAVGRDALGQGAGDGHAVGLHHELPEPGEERRELVGGDLRAALEQLGLVALVQDADADTRLARDRGEVVGDAVGVHEVAHVSAHVAAEQAGREDIVAELEQDAAHVEALSARGLFRGHAVHVVDGQAIEMVRGVDRGIHGDGEDHVQPFRPNGIRCCNCSVTCEYVAGRPADGRRRIRKQTQGELYKTCFARRALGR